MQLTDEVNWTMFDFLVAAVILLSTGLLVVKIHKLFKSQIFSLYVWITNIFKVLRVEYVRQLGSTYVGNDFIDKSGIRFRAEMSF